MLTIHNIFCQRSALEDRYEFAALPVPTGRFIPASDAIPPNCDASAESPPPLFFEETGMITASALNFFGSTRLTTTASTDAVITIHAINLAMAFDDVPVVEQINLVSVTRDS